MSNDATPDLSSLLFARAPLALSRTQRLVSTWLPPPTTEELLQNTQSLETKEEEDDTFMPTSELSGLGAKYTAEDEREAMTVRSDEKLKLLLLGKDGMRKRQGNGTISKPAAVTALAPKRNLASAQTRMEISSGDEDGRTSLGKAKASRDKAGLPVYEAIDDDGSRDDTKLALRAELLRPGRKATAANYLDEVLAQKASKGRNKRRRKKQHIDAKESI